MRILVISTLFPRADHTKYGVFVARHLAELQRLGEDLKVIVPMVWAPKIVSKFERWKYHDHTRQPLAYAGLDVQSVAFKLLPGRWARRWDGLSIFRAMKRDVLRLHHAKAFDIVYGIYWMQGADVAVRLSRFLQIPALGYAVGSDINLVPHFSKRLFRHFVWIANSLDATQAMGQSVADKIDAVCGKKTLEVAGVVDLAQFAPAADDADIKGKLGIPRSKVVVLYVGRLSVAKGVNELLEAFFRIREVMPNVLLRMCGDGPDRSRLAGLIDERGAGEAVELVGRVAPEDMHLHMQASDLFVLPSHSEGMPNVVMEAMACGLPVVTTSVGGLPASLGKCEGAILVPPQDADAFERAVLTVLRDPERRRRMGQRAREKAERDFGVTPNARRVISHLASTVEKYRQGNGGD